MAGKNTAVFGIYPNKPAVEEAVDHLRSAGFRSTDISVLFPENQGTKDFAHEKNTKAPEGATTGGVAGGIAGGVLGWLTGIGALAIPGIGPFIAAGPIVAALAGAGAVGALGGIIGALVGMGIPEYEAKRYEGRIREGGVLLSVHCDNSDWVKRAKDVLVHTGAQDIASAGEKSGDFANADKPLPRTRTAGSTSTVTDEELYDERPASRGATRVTTTNVDADIDDVDEE
jgi:Alternative complex III, ActD subunit/Heat induced stress protein YflT domain